MNNDRTRDLPYNSFVDSAGIQYQLISGNPIDVHNFDPNMVNIYDIAWNLSNQCRYNGSCYLPWSVLQHTLFVLEIVYTLFGEDSIPNPDSSHAISPTILYQQALFHDAEEAYLPDLCRPVKNKMPKYVELGDTLRSKIMAKYDIPITLDERIIYADNLALSFEVPVLMPQGVDNELYPLDCFHHVERVDLNNLFKYFLELPRAAIFRRFINKCRKHRIDIPRISETGKDQRMVQQILLHWAHLTPTDVVEPIGDIGQASTPIGPIGSRDYQTG